ncbi:MAG: hypothetical protein D6694_07030, partial [Gammaproteobacteria bacterium]
MDIQKTQEIVDAVAAHLIEGGKFDSIVQARKFVEQIGGFGGDGIRSGNVLAKEVEEAIERGVVRAALVVLESAETTHEAFDLLVDIYSRQPNLSTRTSTSIKNQAYSTPIPIAYLASVLAGIQPGQSVYEPAAGHGALLIEATPGTVYANEINPDRVEELKARGYQVAQSDGSIYLPPEQVDVVVMNPPFGSVRQRQDNGELKNRSWTVQGGSNTPAYTTSQIDHAIALHALQSMKDDGRAVLILGAPMAQKMGNEKASSESYNGLMTVRFWLSLYQNYNVTQHFTLSGDLYARQGTTYPVDVVVIDGRGRSKLELPAARLPKVYRSFEDLKREILPNAVRSISRKKQGVGYEGELDEAANGRAAARQPGVDQHDERIPESAGTPAGVDDRRADQGVGGGVGRGVGRGTGGTGKDPERAGSPGDRGDHQQLLKDGESLPGGQSDAVGGRNGSRFLRLSRGPGLPGDERVSTEGSIQFPSDSLGGGGGGGSSRVDPRNVSGRVVDIDEGGDDRARSRLGSVLQQVSQQSSIQQVGVAMAEESAAVEAMKSQVPYSPQSKMRTGGTLLPVNMATPVKASLSKLEKQVGSLDRFIDAKAGLSDMNVQLMAEQVDAVSLAISNLERGDAFILGDQTGIGKGIQLATIAKAFMKGNVNLGGNVKTLVFCTYDSALYSAFIQDLRDVGVNDIRPLFTNTGFELRLPDGTIFRTNKDAKKHGNLMREVARQVGMTGGLGEDYSIVFTTYSQLQTVRGKTTDRREFLSSIAPNALFIFDESHNAGGTEQQMFDSDRALMNRADFTRFLVRTAGGVVFSSATYAKNPYTMTLYSERTEMRHALDDSSSFVDMVKSGGVPLQQMLASSLTRSGQYIRRERSYEGVRFDARSVEVGLPTAERLSELLQMIMQFDELKAEGVKALDLEAKSTGSRLKQDGSTGNAGAQSANFTSIMHNLIGQALLALKAESVVQEALQALRNGEKPVIALSNTMGSLIGREADEQGVEVGEEIPISFGDVIRRYLERSRDVTIRTAFAEKPERRPLTDEELGDDAAELYREIEELINTTNWDGMPISPIDYIRHRLEQENYSTGEITGRSDRVEYTDDGRLLYQVRGDKERNPNAKREVVDGFNSGDLDAIILNRSGSTGLSIHASERFVDQRPRHMIIAQPEADINLFMQMLGRVHRTGQVVLPRFTLAAANIPAERRPTAILMKKLASLNANTSAAPDSGFNLADSVDFMNEYGDRVICELLFEREDLNARLGYPLKEGLKQNRDGEVFVVENAIAKVTGRIPLLPLKEQEELYDLIITEYKELVERESALGNNILKAETLDLDAKTIARMEVLPPKQGIDSPMGGAVYLEVVDAKSLRKPLTQLEVVNRLRKELEMPLVEDLFDHRPDDLARESRFALALLRDDVRGKTSEFLKDYRDGQARWVERQMERERKRLQKKIGKLQESEEGGDPTKQIDLEAELSKIRASLEEEVSTKVADMSQRVGRQQTTVISNLEAFPLGQAVRVVNALDKSVYYGVVEKVVHKSSGKGSPVSPSTWKLQIQIADSARQVTVPFTKIDPSGEKGYQIEARNFDHDGNDIYDLFDIRQGLAREERQIFTGNVIRGYEKFKGKLINFKDSYGNVRQGILMPKGFDIEKALEKQPVKLSSIDHVRRFFDETRNMAFLKSFDGALTVRCSYGGGLQLETDKAKGRGGKYFLDEKLLGKMGVDFVSGASAMFASVSADRVEETLKYMLESYRGLYATESRSIARKIVGQELPSMESLPDDFVPINVEAQELESLPAPDVPHVEVTQDAILGLERSLILSDDPELEAEERRIEAELELIAYERSEMEAIAQLQPEAEPEPVAQPEPVTEEAIARLQPEAEPEPVAQPEPVTEGAIAQPEPVTEG